MNHRTAGIASIAATSFATIGLLALAAAAGPAPGTLAPGVQCGSPFLECSNDTNQTYRIDWVATCAYNEALVDPITVPEHTWIAPHERIALMVGVNNAYCPPEISGREPTVGQFDPGGLTWAQYQDAVVDNSHPPAPAWPLSGSAG